MLSLVKTFARAVGPEHSRIKNKLFQRDDLMKHNQVST